jgi:hypothetical protein
MAVRPLRELLADLVGDGAARADGSAAYLAEHGHDLPQDLLAEAVVSFADTAPPGLAERLSPFVTAHTSGEEEPADWFDLLTTAPPDLTDEVDGVDEVDGGDDLDAEHDAGQEQWSDFGTDPGQGLDFGSGAVDDLHEAPDVEPVHTPDADWSADPADTIEETPAEQDVPAQEVAVEDDDLDEDAEED